MARKPKKDNLVKKFVSVFEKVKDEIEGLDLESMQEKVISEVQQAPQVSDEAKRQMVQIIENKTSPKDLLFYVWNAYMSYLDPSLRVVKTNLLKKAMLELVKIAEELENVDEIPEISTIWADRNIEIPEFQDVQIYVMPIPLFEQEFGLDIPIFRG